MGQCTTDFWPRRTAPTATPVRAFAAIMEQLNKPEPAMVPIAPAVKPAVSAQPVKARPQRQAVTVKARGKDGPLVERYRPARLAEIVGQPDARRVLDKFAAKPYPTAFLFEGDTGTGKTSAAIALAAELGCAVEQAEYGGVWQIASGEQSADNVRQTCERLHYLPMCGSGWRVFIVNECDRMNPAAETIWLDRLEALPARAVVIFTTNYPDKLSQRFVDRCISVRFESQASKLRLALEGLLVAVWNDAAGEPVDAELIERIIEDSIKGTRLSFRRALQMLQAELPAPVESAA